MQTEHKSISRIVKKGSRGLLKTLMILCTFLLLLLANWITINNFIPQLIITVSSEQEAQATLYADYGNGHKQFISFLNEYQSNHEKAEIYFPLKKTLPKKIRFDPIPKTDEEPFEFEIHAIQLKLHHFAPLIQLPIKHLQPLSGVNLTPENGILKCKIAPHMTDPQLTITLPTNMEVLKGASAQRSLHIQVLLSSMAFGLSLLIVILYPVK